MKQFWHESITDESFRFLHSLAKESDFVLIGGWAAYLHTRLQKSKDIDIVVDFEELRRLDAKFGISKNERLRKYEIKQGGFDIDVYVPGFSHLSYSPERILARHETIDGMKVAKQSQLLLLKLGAYSDRKGSEKGEKDAIDIIGLLLSPKFGRADFLREAEFSSVKEPLALLHEIASSFPESALQFVGTDFVSFKKWRKEFLKSR